MRRGMGGNGLVADAGDAGAAPPEPAAMLWDAAADAMLWEASIHEHAANVQSRKAWAASAKADSMMCEAADECGRAAGAPDRMDVVAVWRAIDAIRRAARQLVRVSKAFMLSSDLFEAAGAEQRQASNAFARSTVISHAAPTYAMSVESNERALAEAKRSKIAIEKATDILGSAGRLAEGAARTGDGRAGDAGRKAMSSVRAALLEDARRSSLLAKAVRGRTRKAERTAARVLRLAATAAGKSAEAATAVMARGAGGQGVKEAEAAWRRAAESAEKEAKMEEARGLERQKRRKKRTA